MADTKTDAGTKANAETGNPTGEKKDAGTAGETKVESTIPSRKSSAYFVGLRHGEKKATSKDETGNAGAGTDEELTPEALKAIEDAARKSTTPVLEALSRKLDDDDIRDHLAKHPDHSKFEGAVRKQMSERGWEAVPAPVIFSFLSGAGATADPAQAQAEAKAREEAEKNAVGGGAARKLEGGEAEKNAFELSNEEFESEIQKAKTLVVDRSRK